MADHYKIIRKRVLASMATVVLTLPRYEHSFNRPISYSLLCIIVHIAGEEVTKKKSIKFVHLLFGMGIRSSKTIANNCGSPPSILFAMNQILDTSVYG